MPCALFKASIPLVVKQPTAEDSTSMFDSRFVCVGFLIVSQMCQTLCTYKQLFEHLMLGHLTSLNKALCVFPGPFKR